MERKRIVVKIGSSSLTNTKGEIDAIKIYRSCCGIATLKQAGS